MNARQPELTGKVFGDKEGNLYEGERFIVVPDENYATGFRTTQIFYHKGKLHGTPAIVYPDGHKEDWENGKFIKVYTSPYH